MKSKSAIKPWKRCAIVVILRKNPSQIYSWFNFEVRTKDIPNFNNRTARHSQSWLIRTKSSSSCDMIINGKEKLSVREMIHLCSRWPKSWPAKSVGAGDKNTRRNGASSSSSLRKEVEIPDLKVKADSHLFETDSRVNSPPEVKVSYSPNHEKSCVAGELWHRRYSAASKPRSLQVIHPINWLPQALTTKHSPAAPVPVTACGQSQAASGVQSSPSNFPKQFICDCCDLLQLIATSVMKVYLFSHCQRNVR